MPYLKAILWSLVAATGTGAAVLVGAIVRGFWRYAAPADRATVLAAGISDAMNCAVFFAILLLPFALVNAFLSRRQRARHDATGGRTSR